MVIPLLGQAFAGMKTKEPCLHPPDIFIGRLVVSGSFCIAGRSFSERWSLWKGKLIYFILLRHISAVYISVQYSIELNFKEEKYYTLINLKWTGGWNKIRSDIALQTGWLCQKKQRTWQTEPALATGVMICTNRQRNVSVSSGGHQRNTFLPALQLGLQDHLIHWKE